MKDNKSIIWLSIKSNEILRQQMNAFLEFLRGSKVHYTSYSSNSVTIYMELKLPIEISSNPTCEFHRELGSWIFYNPIISLKRKPKVSDYDILEMD